MHVRWDGHVQRDEERDDVEFAEDGLEGEVVVVLVHLCSHGHGHGCLGPSGQGQRWSMVPVRTRVR